MTTTQKWTELRGMSVKEALRTGKGMLCPTCRRIHPGVTVPSPYIAFCCAKCRNTFLETEANKTANKRER